MVGVGTTFNGVGLNPYGEGTGELPGRTAYAMMNEQENTIIPDFPYEVVQKK